MAQHKVLIPVDGSEFSRQIFPVVSQFLAPEENSIILLRVAEKSGGHTGHPARVMGMDPTVPVYEYEQDLRESQHPIFASQEMESVAASVRQEMKLDMEILQAAGYSVQPVVRFGSPGEQIVEYAEHNDVDLVAMTTHGRRGIVGLLLGSVAKHVSQNLHVPVLLMRPLESR
jgi:nucleotide-binding universal stress UspA family protein